MAATFSEQPDSRQERALDLMQIYGARNLVLTRTGEHQMKVSKLIKTVMSGSSAGIHLRRGGGIGVSVRQSMERIRG